MGAADALTVAAVFAAACYPRPTRIDFPTVRMESRPVAAIAQSLAALGYTVNVVDEKSGIVNTEWYEYGAQFGANFVPMPVRERVQVLVGKMALDVRFEAQCDWRRSAAGGNAATLMLGDHGESYYGRTAGWEPCLESSAIPNTEVRERYAAVLASLREVPGERAVTAQPAPAVPARSVAVNAECTACAAQCRPQRELCNSGDVAACKNAGACLCRCKLAAGGCGEPVESLVRCAETLTTEPPTAP